jgi:hypothetical protein
VVAASADAESAFEHAERAGRDALFSWVGAAAGSAFLFLVGSWLARPWTGGDTPFVLDGTSALFDCLSRRDFVACRMSEKLDYWGLISPMGDWPPFQYMVDAVSIGLGAEQHNDRERVFSTLSVAGVVSAVVLARAVLVRVGQRAWFWGFLLVVLSGPIIAYARSTAGEALAAGLLICVVAATVLRAPPPLVAVAAFAACLTKETSYPFVAALGLLGLVLARRRTGEPIRTHVIWGVGGLAASFVLASLFNIVRFGSILNTNYLQPELHTPGIGRKLEYTLALFVSPNGGMLFFWPAASVLLAAACLVPFVLRGRKLDPRPSLVLVAVTLVLAVGFASWWTPFGWGGYGPRLTMPWVLPLVLLGLVAYGEPLGHLVRRFLASPWRLLAVFGVVLALTLPHVGYMWKVSSIGGFFDAQTPSCDAPWRIGVEEFHACQHELMWQGRPVSTYAVEGVVTRGGAVTSFVIAVGLLGSLILLRRELGVRGEDGE